MAILRTHQILSHDLDLENEKLTKIQLLASQGVLHIQAKVDESRLKRRKLDVLPKLIELVREERAKRAPVIDLSPAGS